MRWADYERPMLVEKRIVKGTTRGSLDSPYFSGFASEMAVSFWLADLTGLPRTLRLSIPVAAYFHSLICPTPVNCLHQTTIKRTNQVVAENGNS